MPERGPVDDAATAGRGEPPRVTVIVPSYNHAPYLRECIDSVLSQDYPALELVVVDDGSSDDSLEILRSYGSRLTLLQQHRGRQARARNLALQVATGEFLAFLDSDDRYRPGRIAHAMAVFAAHPETDLTWSDYRLIDREGRPIGEQAWRGGGSDFALDLLAGNPICNATVTVRRRVIEAIGGFDESVPRVCDGAAWYQVAARGHRFRHLPEALVDYRMHGANDSADFARMTHDRDLALVSGARAYFDAGRVPDVATARRVRDGMVRQFAFLAAAEVQSRLPRGVFGGLATPALRALGSMPSLQVLSRLRAIKRQGRSSP